VLSRFAQLEIAWRYVKNEIFFDILQRQFLNYEYFYVVKQIVLHLDLKYLQNNLTSVGFFLFLYLTNL
jgi:hypothetical protein